MRNEGSIRQKLKQAQYRHMKRALIDRLPPGEEWSEAKVNSIKAEYREFFSNSPIHVIAKSFPDVATLMWVLDDQPDNDLMIDGTLVGKLGGVMLWADSEDDAAIARSTVEFIISEATKNTTKDPIPTVEPELVEEATYELESASTDLEIAIPKVRKSLWERIFG